MNNPPFSTRYPWHSPRNRLSLAIESRKLAGLPITDLTVSNPTQTDLKFPANLSLAAYTPEAAGALNTREAIAAYYWEEFATNISPERIVLTTSTSEAYSYCFKLIADPGAEVLLPQPSYPLLQFLVEAEGLRPVPYPLHPAAGQWLLDRDRLAAACTPNTRAIVLVHPNNPTGHWTSLADLDWLREFSAGRYWLISDEVFADYAWQQTSHRSLTQVPAQNAFTLSGLSKICALPQMKLGWIILPPDPTIRRNMDFIADTYLSVSSPIQQAAPQWIANRSQFQAPIRQRCLKNLTLLQNTLANTPWTPLPAQAGWSAILQGPSNIEEESLALQLLEIGILIQPGYYYDLPFPTSIVISLLTAPDDLQLSLQRGLLQTQSTL